MMDLSIEERLGVIGGGYVGLVSGACFASLGFNVTIVEVDGRKLADLRRGVPTIYEPGMKELLEEGLASGRLSFVGSTKELFAMGRVDVAFIAVGTPSRPDGSCDLSYVDRAADDVVLASKADLVLVLKSTVPIGTARRLRERIEASGATRARRVAVINNPEFLKEGSAIADFMRPDRVVIGGSESWAVDKLKALYESLLNNGHPLFVTEHETAELAKLGANLMLASRVSLINQVSRLSSEVGADIKQIESILRTDSRIGSKYLYAGLGYGGSCFPKDVKSFIHQCRAAGVDASLASAVDGFNDSQKTFFMDDIRRAFPRPADTTIALLGVAFKPNTDDIRESPALVLATELRRAGYRVRAYDPKALRNFEAWARASGVEGVECAASAVEAVRGVAATVFVTEWQEFQHLSPTRLRDLMQGRRIYDGKNTLRPKAFRDAGFEYVGVGRS
jgi:UDPglucose 6-dehydrogenase